MIINVLLITDIAGARISTEASRQLLFGYLFFIYEHDSEENIYRSIMIIINGLFTSIAGEWISTIVKYGIYNSLKQLRRSIWYLIITWLINEGIHITCDCLILPWKIPSLWCLTWIMKVGLFMIGLTTYEIFSHNKLINKSSDR